MKKVIKLVLIPILLILALAFLALGPLSTLKVIGQEKEAIAEEVVDEIKLPESEVVESETTTEPAIESEVTANDDEDATEPTVEESSETTENNGPTTEPTAEDDPAIEPTTGDAEVTEPAADETLTPEEPDTESVAETETVKEKRELGAFLIEVLHLNVISDKIGNHLFTTISSFLSALCFESSILLILSLFKKKGKTKNKAARHIEGMAERKLPEPIEGNNNKKSPIKF